MLKLLEVDSGRQWIRNRRVHNRIMFLLNRRDNCWTDQVKTIRLLNEIIIVKNLFELRLRPLIIFFSNLFF
jgi:hypothetical protein